MLRVLKEKKKSLKPDIAEATKLLYTIEKEIENLIKAIKAGIITESTKIELQRAEQEKKKLISTLSVDSKELDNIVEILPKCIDKFYQVLEDISNIPQGQIAKMRTHIGVLVGNEIILKPTESEGLEAYFYGDYAGMLNLVPTESKLSLVAGAGFEPTTFRL